MLLGLKLLWKVVWCWWLSLICVILTVQTSDPFCSEKEHLVVAELGKSCILSV